jgi:transposase
VSSLALRRVSNFGRALGERPSLPVARSRPDEVPVQRFGCFTTELIRMAVWLKGRGVQTVAMQSTGVYWIPLYDILEEHGIKVYLVNARDTKNLPSRKTDVQESQWLLKLHTYGLLCYGIRSGRHRRFVFGSPTGGSVINMSRRLASASRAFRKC